jgi:hypothetical protein
VIEGVNKTGLTSEYEAGKRWKVQVK